MSSRPTIWDGARRGASDPGDLTTGTLTSVYAVGDTVHGIGTPTGVNFVPLVGAVAP